MIAADDLDAIYIPLPTGMRKDWVIKAANAGKHVMCEKPCAIDSEELEAMTSACAANKVQFMDGVMYMHSDRMAKLREALDDSENVEARNDTSILGGLSLGIIEVSGDCNNGIFDGFA